jgi:putative addiction module component (TIGR02574 family)
MEAKMGSPTLEKARSEALSLSEAERAELAHSLVASLDGPPDADAEAAWDAEIRRRLAEIDSGTAELIDREELRRSHAGTHEQRLMRRLRIHAAAAEEVAEAAAWFEREGVIPAHPSDMDSGERSWPRC